MSGDSRGIQHCGGSEGLPTRSHATSHEPFSQSEMAGASGSSFRKGYWWLIIIYPVDMGMEIRWWDDMV